MGRATAARLRADGCRVVVFDVLEPEDPVDEFVAVDLADRAATARALEQALTGRTITRLVNNVGAVRPALLEDASLDDFDYLMALNVRSAIQ
ncbi:MAG: SDR family oxidoreductase, partial [Rhodospirillaceae bacterium]|nr:SDR family oxidoreductase [Rhodospirillaceae bacterium]